MLFQVSLLVHSHQQVAFTLFLRPGSHFSFSSFLFLFPLFFSLSVPKQISAICFPPSCWNERFKRNKHDLLPATPATHLPLSHSFYSERIHKLSYWVCLLPHLFRMHPVDHPSATFVCSALASRAGTQPKIVWPTRLVLNADQGS